MTINVERLRARHRCVISTACFIPNFTCAAPAALGVETIVLGGPGQGALERLVFLELVLQLTLVVEVEQAPNLSSGFNVSSAAQ